MEGYRCVDHNLTLNPAQGGSEDERIARRLTLPRRRRQGPRSRRQGRVTRPIVMVTSGTSVEVGVTVPHVGEEGMPGTVGYVALVSLSERRVNLRKEGHTWSGPNSCLPSGRLDPPDRPHSCSLLLVDKGDDRKETL